VVSAMSEKRGRLTYNHLWSERVCGAVLTDTDTGTLCASCAPHGAAMLQLAKTQYELAIEEAHIQWNECLGCFSTIAEAEKCSNFECPINTRRSGALQKMRTTLTWVQKMIGAQGVE